MNAAMTTVKWHFYKKWPISNSNVSPTLRYAPSMAFTPSSLLEIPNTSIFQQKKKYRHNIIFSEKGGFLFEK